MLQVLDRSDVPQQKTRDIAAQDLLAIIKGMTDAAGQSGEHDQRYLATRISSAVYGYLDVYGHR